MFNRKFMFKLFATLLMGIFAISIHNAQAQDNSQDQGQAKLIGTVIDSTTSKPVADVTVSLDGQDKEATTDQNGQFMFNDLSAGTYTVNIEADGYEAYSKDVEISGQGASLDIKLTPASSQ